MEKIIITIPDNLSPAEEAIAVAKHLGKKMLPQGSKLLGTGYELKSQQTRIIINREAVEKPIVTIECSVCETVTEKKLSKKLWINYGGKTRQIHMCSDRCKDDMQNFCGNRAASKRSDLKPVFVR